MTAKFITLPSDDWIVVLDALDEQREIDIEAAKQGYGTGRDKELKRIIQSMRDQWPQRKVPFEAQAAIRVFEKANASTDVKPAAERGLSERDVMSLIKEFAPNTIDAIEAMEGRLLRCIENMCARWMREMQPLPLPSPDQIEEAARPRWVRGMREMQLLPSPDQIEEATRPKSPPVVVLRMEMPSETSETPEAFYERELGPHADTVEHRPRVRTRQGSRAAGQTAAPPDKGRAAKRSGKAAPALSRVHVVARKPAHGRKATPKRVTKKGSKR
jgi:hypothetical protein